MREVLLLLLGLSILDVSAYGETVEYTLPVQVDSFEIHEHRPFTVDQGLPDNDVSAITTDNQGGVTAITAKGSARFNGTTWTAAPDADEAAAPNTRLHPQHVQALESAAGGALVIRDVAEYAGELAVAADQGLFTGNGSAWHRVLPRQGYVRWAPIDVRAVAYDASGALWFASPQGVGRRLADDEWELYTGADGLPYNDFTCMETGPKGVWFGTTNGAILYQARSWAFRQGRRWLLDDRVNDIAVDADGNAWIATPKGVSCITSTKTSLSRKARFYEEEIEKYHRRTSLGYVNPADLSAPGDKSTAKPSFTDNDGHNTGMYLAAMSLGYAATGDARLKRHASNAFRALAFLSEVTQGGTHPAPSGFIARAVRPTSEPDPNPQFDLAYDLKRKERDSLWKIIQPRWPKDETGEWYWKNDSSSDELDGHFFGYATYYDRACETEEEREAVRLVVRRIIDHIIDHGYNLVDYDGQPTRWGRLSPDDLNRNEAWVIERGLNSFSMLTYLSIAHHILGDQKYWDAYMALAIEHGYGMNGMTQPKDIAGPGTFGQPDDNMAFMNYYHLIRYETDPKLLSMYFFAISRHWSIEKYERNAFENFIYAACCSGKVRRDQWGENDLTPPLSCFEDAIDTLKRYPLDLVDWPMSNAHRIDMVHLPDHVGQSANTGHRVDGYVFPIDERHEVYWDRDPWVLSYDGRGMKLREGFHYLLAYYMGRAHGFITE